MAIIWSSPYFPQFHLRHALDPVAGRILNNFTHRDRVIANPGDQTIILSHVLSLLDLVDGAVDLQQAKHHIILFHGADHLHGIQREALEEFLATVLVRRLRAAGAILGQLGQQLAGVERIQHVAGRVGERHERLRFRQRLDGRLGLRLDVLHPAAHLLHVALAAGGQQQCANEGG